MRKMKRKEYWVRESERFARRGDAKARAAQLRGYQNVSYIRCTKEEEGYKVSYSAARFYLEELQRARIVL